MYYPINVSLKKVITVCTLTVQCRWCRGVLGTLTIASFCLVTLTRVNFSDAGAQLEIS